MREGARAGRWIASTGESPQNYSRSSAALAITLLSRQRQRRSFYYAGVINTGAALWLIAEHYEWFDDPLWAISVVASVCSR